MAEKVINSKTQTIKIKEFDLNRIMPNSKNYMSGEMNGVKIICVGKPRSGKSTLVKTLLYNKSNLLPCGVVMSGTEDTNGSYKKFIPDSFIYNTYREDVLEKLIERQKLAIHNLPNPFAFLVIDDLGDDKSVYRRPTQMNLFKNGRHLQLFYILALQYSMDIFPAIRQSTDFVFIFKENNIRFRKSLHENYAGAVGDFTTFCAVMDQLTEDRTALVIDNTTTSNKMEDIVFWYNAKNDLPPETFEMGSPQYWQFHNERYNPEYKH